MRVLIKKYLVLMFVYFIVGFCGRSALAQTPSSSPSPAPYYEVCIPPAWPLVVPRGYPQLNEKGKLLYDAGPSTDSTLVVFSLEKDIETWTDQIVYPFFWDFNDNNKVLYFAGRSAFNNNEDLVSDIELESGERHAYAYLKKTNQPVDIHAAFLSPLGYVDSYMLDINNNGEAVGLADKTGSGSASDVIYWKTDGTFSFLALPSGIGSGQMTGYLDTVGISQNGKIAAVLVDETGKKSTLIIWNSRTAAPQYFLLQQKVEKWHIVKINNFGDVAMTLADDPIDSRSYSSYLFKSGQLFKLKDRVIGIAPANLRNASDMNNKAQIAGQLVANDGVSKLSYLARPATQFLRGDANRDGLVNLKDVQAITDHISKVHVMISDLDAGDVNDDGVIDNADVTRLNNYLTTHLTPPPAAPFPSIGYDLNNDCLP